MAKTTVYLNKDVEDALRRAKEYDPDYTASIAAAEGVRAFVAKMDIQTKGMCEVIILDGELDKPTGDTFGRRVKFVGKKLSSYSVETGMDKSMVYTLFYTRKGNYVVQIAEDDVDYVKSKFVKFDSLKDLRAAGYPPNLLKNAETVPGELCEELDI